MQSALWVMLGTALLATLSWDAPWLLPFKLLVVLVHEIWHALLTVLTGGQVDGLSIGWDGSGETSVTGLTGLIPFTLSVSAGYLGSMIVGGVLLACSLQRKRERMILLSLGISLGYFAALYMEPMGLAFNTAAGWAAAFGLASFLPGWFMRIMLGSTGTVIVWYCLYDMFDFAGQIEHTDAGILAQFLVQQGMVVDADFLSYAISFSWVAIMLAVMAYTLWPALRSGEAPSGQEGGPVMVETCLPPENPRF
ncbi:MAG: M50 family metallopeptidase [Spirochaetales bacterium]|nr:M50 family metallopeptidase [Spirochaetales bacterium]